MYAEAISEFRAALALHMGAQPLAQLGHAYALSGRRVEALKVLDQLKEVSKESFVSPFDFAIVFLGLGEKDQAIACFGAWRLLGNQRHHPLFSCSARRHLPDPC